MKVERWRQLASLYNQAVGMDERQRTDFLREACGSDEELRNDLEELFAEESEVGSFLEEAALREIAHEFAATAEEPRSSWMGRRIGNYEFLSLVGAGGMGEVYRACDTKLKRDVAIKILPDEFSADPERISRFQREAQVLASLNHPNIAAIYDLEEADGSCFLILELVEGETLADRIQRGPIPVEDALKIALQIAEALNAAHEKSVIHRDLKPANIKVTADGKVKVLDFGLAKALLGDIGVNPSNSPTRSISATQQGVLMGTAAYMSPEQARGEAVDGRADVWAFGCVLYEMLTGRQTFPGEGVSGIVASVLRSEPDWGSLPGDTPSSVRRLLRRCLRKDRNRRLRAIGDARIEIEETGTEPEYSEPAAPNTKPHRREVLAWIAAGTGAAVAGAFGVVYFRESARLLETRLEIATPAGRPSLSRISPDGRKIVFSASVDGRARKHLWLRRIESERPAEVLPETEDARSAFWSPDSRSIGFNTSDQLWRLDLDGGKPRPLAKSGSTDVGAAWGPDGTILFSPSRSSPLYRVSSTGSSPQVEVTHLNSRHLSHRFPDFLPGGRHFLFFVEGKPDVQGVYIGSLDDKETRLVLKGDSAAVFMDPNYVLFRRNESLMAQRLDLKALETAGESFSVADDVAGSDAGGSVGEVAVSTSRTGSIAYRAQERTPRQLTWFDRTGRPTGTLGGVDPSLAQFRISPDDRSVAVTRIIKGTVDAWLIEEDRPAFRQITSDAAIEGSPLWDPNGSRIAFSSRGSVWLKRIAGGSEEKLWESGGNEFLEDWSPDGGLILFRRNGHLFLFSVEQGGKPKPVTNSGGDNTRFSPDGRWMAYKIRTPSTEGDFQIEVAPFSGGDPKQVSIKGGGYPHWTKDGHEILYWAGPPPLKDLTAAPVRLKPNGELEFGTPTALGLKFSDGEQGFDVTRNGQRILVNKKLGPSSTPPIIVISNWKPKR